jgi:hypothetical protein
MEFTIIFFVIFLFIFFVFLLRFFIFLCTAGTIESLAGVCLRELFVITNEFGAGADISFTSGDVVWSQELDS